MFLKAFEERDTSSDVEVQHSLQVFGGRPGSLLKTGLLYLAFLAILFFIFSTLLFQYFRVFNAHFLMSSTLLCCLRSSLLTRPLSVFPYIVLSTFISTVVIVCIVSVGCSLVLTAYFMTGHTAVLYYLILHSLLKCLCLQTRSSRHCIVFQIPVTCDLYHRYLNLITCSLIFFPISILHLLGFSMLSCTQFNGSQLS